MYNDDFYASLAIGQRGEEMVFNALTKKGHNVLDVSDDTDYQWIDIDFQVSRNGRTTTLEVKNDLASERSGNVFVETWNQKNQRHNYQGWYYYCEAEFIAFVQENKRIAHIIRRDELNALIDNNNYRIGKTYNTEGYLVPIGDLERQESYCRIEL